jgi:hypothetical protein
MRNTVKWQLTALAMGLLSPLVMVHPAMPAATTTTPAATAAATAASNNVDFQKTVDGFAAALSDYLAGKDTLPACTGKPITFDHEGVTMNLAIYSCMREVIAKIPVDMSAGYTKADLGHAVQYWLKNVNDGKGKMFTCVQNTKQAVLVSVGASVISGLLQPFIDAFGTMAVDDLKEQERLAKVPQLSAHYNAVVWTDPTDNSIVKGLEFWSKQLKKAPC